MGMPKLDLASLQCPHCAGLTRLTGITRADNGSEHFSFECGDCGPFEVLAPHDPDDGIVTERSPARPDPAVRDLWA